MSNIETIIGVPAGGKHTKPHPPDISRLHTLANQLARIGSELNDIKGTINEMLDDQQAVFDTGAYDEYEGDTPLDKMENISCSIDGAISELSDAIDMIQEMISDNTKRR